MTVSLIELSKNSSSLYLLNGSVMPIRFSRARPSKLLVVRVQMSQLKGPFLLRRVSVQSEPHFLHQLGKQYPKPVRLYSEPTTYET